MLRPKYHILLFVACIITFAASSSFAQAGAVKRMKTVIDTLASDSMHGRMGGSADERKAGEYISGIFREIKLKKGAGKSYFQEFDYQPDSLTDKSSRNIIGLINNHKDSTIVIGAHYDHLGMGGRRSRSIGKHQIHNGADDNASGVALMIELARFIKQKKHSNYNYVFVAFGAHEEGLFGSHYFVNSNIIDTNAIALMINFDMLGRMDIMTSTLAVGGKDSWRLSDSLIRDDSTDCVSLRDKELPKGDHSAFLSKHIPVLYFTTGIHNDYHTINDDADKINYPGMFCILEWMEELLLKVEKQN